MAIFSSDGAHVTGSLNVLGDTKVSGILSSSVGRLDSTKRGLIMTGSADIQGGIAITGSLGIGDQFGLGSVSFSNLNATIVDGNQLGSIIWRGEDSGHPGVGAKISATARGAWDGANDNPTNLKFFTQDNSSINTLNTPRMIISASAAGAPQRQTAGLGYSAGTVAVDKDFVAYGTGSFVGGLQIGEVTGDNQWPNNQSADVAIPYQKLRVSNEHGDVSIAIDAKAGSVGSIVWGVGGDGRPANTAGWFYDNSASNFDKYSFRQGDLPQDQGAIVVSKLDISEGPTVRFAGGGRKNDGPDNKPGVIISGSDNTEPSYFRIRALGPNPTTVVGAGTVGFKADNIPLMSFEQGHNSLSEKMGNYWLGVTNQQTGTETRLQQFAIAHGSANLGTAWLNKARILTLDGGGLVAKVGIGAPDTISTTQNAFEAFAGIIPSASLHVENQSNQAMDWDYNLDNAQVFVRNSKSGVGEVAATIAFDASQNKKPERYTGRIGFTRDRFVTDDQHGGYFQLGVFGWQGTATGEVGSLAAQTAVRTRMRIDGQGSVNLLSGSYLRASSGGRHGFPANQIENYWEIDEADVPSGSLNLISLNNGTKTEDTTNGQWYGNTDQPTINLISWTGTQHSGSPGKAGVTAGTHMGRIAWWSADSDFNLYSERVDQVGAYIEGVASHNHDATDKSPTWVDIYTRGYQGALPARRMRVSSSSVRFTGEVDVESGIIKHLGAPRLTMNGDGTTVIGALQVNGNIIKASDGGSTITMDTDDKVTLAGTLQVSGNEILDNDGVTMLSFDSSGNIDDIAMITQDVIIGGALPTLTLGTGADEDIALRFNSDVNDFYVGSDAGTDSFMVGPGTTPGVYVAQQILSSSLVAFPEGIYQSPAVTVGGGGTTLNPSANQWIRILKTPGAALSQDQVSGVYLVTLAGSDNLGADFEADWSWIVSVRYGTTGNPMDADATSIRIEQLDTSIRGAGVTAFNPNTDIKLVDDGARNAEVWIKNLSKNKQCFVTHLGGGSNGAHLSDRNDSSFVVQSHQTWFPSAPVGSGANVFGQWTSKEFYKVTAPAVAVDIIEAKSTNITLDAVGDIILSADGDQISMDDGQGNTRFTFNLDATPELDVNGDFIIDATSVDIKDELKITGTDPTLTIGDGGDEDIRLLFNSDTNDYYIGSDATDDRLHFGYGATPGSSAVAHINQNVSFVANTFETINWCTNIYSADTSGSGTYRMFHPLGTSGIDWTTTTSITGISDRVWIAPCDGAVEACIFSAEYRLRSDGSSTSNRDNVRVHLYRQSATTDSDDATQWSQIGSSIHMMSDNCTANSGNYYGVFYRAGTSQATKRTGSMSTFGFTDPANNDYDTTDGSQDMSTNWTFSRGDKLAFVILYDAYDDTNPFYNEIGDAYTSSPNTIKCKMTVRLDWATDGSF